MTTATINTITKFEVGQSYFCRSVCDYDCIWSFKIVARTAKTIKTECGKTLRIVAASLNHTELVYPLGRYSMAPMLSADKIVK